MTDSSAEERVTVFRTNLLYSVRETIKQTRIHVGFPTSEIFPACSEIPLILSAENKGWAGGGGAVCGKQAWKRQSLQNTPEPRESCLWSTHQCFLNSEIWILIFSLWIKNSCTEYRIYSNILKIEKCILTQLHLFGSTSLNRYQVIAAFRASEARSDSAPEHIPSVCCEKHRADMT